MIALLRTVFNVTCFVSLSICLYLKILLSNKVVQVRHLRKMIERPAGASLLSLLYCRFPHSKSLSSNLIKGLQRRAHSAFTAVSCFDRKVLPTRGDFEL